MSDQASTQPAEEPPATIFTPYRRTQALVVIATALCFLLFWWGGRWLGIPSEPKYQISLLEQPHWGAALLATYIMFLCAVALGTLIAGRSWFFAGLFSATFGLIALSARGGALRYVLFYAADHPPGRPIMQRIFLVLLVEQCLLFLIVGLLWLFFWNRYDALARAAKPQEKRAESENSALLGLLAQFLIMCVIVLLLTPTESKKQVLVSLFVAGFTATSLSEYFFPSRKAGGWYWLAPFAVGAIGYLVAYFNARPWTIGDPSGAFAALARPLPLDYASAAMAGTILGFWIGAERPELAMSLVAMWATGGEVYIRRRKGPAMPPNKPQT